MKTLTLDFPVIGWGSATIEVDDDVDPQDALHDVVNGDIDVVWNGHVEAPIPVFDLRDAVRNEDLGEVPYEIEIN